jgi:peptidoglycan hydrolase-like protein with peptidoglycan-binding domain
VSYSSEVLADSPIRYWPLDDTSGSTADDATNNADGTYSGSPTLGAAGVVGTAVSFLAASSQQVLCPFSGLTTAWSLEFWWKSGGTAGSVIFRDSTASNGWLLILTNSDADVQLRANGTNRTITGLGTTLDNGSWHHIVVTSSGTQVITYVDGSAVDTWSVTAAASTVASPFRFARNGTSSTYYTGSYDEIAIYGSVLSGARVAAHFAASVTIPAVSANQTGSGAFSALVVPVFAVAAALSGSGALSATSLPSHDRAASLAGSGAFSATVAAVTGIAADLTGSGAFTATVVEVEYAAASLTGTGAFSASSFASFTVGASLTGSGAFTADAEDASSPEVDADLTGSGAFTAVAQDAAGTYTDTSNDDDGVYIGDGYAEVVWEPDVVEPPFFVGPLTEDQVRTVAQVIDTAPGALPAFTPAAGRRVYAEAARDRVLINSEDFTYWNGAAAVVEGMKLIDPLLYGGCQITLPGINPQFPDAALGDLVERFRFARVKVQRVRDGAVISTDTKGFVSRVDTSGTTLSLEVAGEAAGALSQMYVPPAVFRRKQDWEHIVCDHLRDARVRAKEHDGGSIGLIKRGGSDGLTIVNETIAVASGALGLPFTWTPNANGVYRKTQKSATIVATAYIDSSLITQSLAQDFAEQWTRVYARGFTANGEIVTNIKTPGLTQGDAPPFGELLEVGMTDADTGTGAAVTTAQQQLAIHNFLDFEDTTPGTFDALMERAVEAFQESAGLNVTGEIGENAWDTLFDLGAIGYSLDEAREYPMSQDARTFKWFRTANGSKLRENPDYDPHFIPNDLAIDVGGPFGKGEIRDFAASKRSPDAGVWTGTLTFRSGLIAGDHSPGDPIDSSDVMDRRDLLPNMRIKLPHFAGGISVYISGVDHGPDETTCLVSEVPATTMEVWQAIERRREAKSNPGRAWSGHTRASQVRNDVAVQWDTSSGWIANKVALVEGWNEVKVPAGQSGIVQRVMCGLQTPNEFAALLTQRPVSVEALNNNPHTSTPLTDPRPSARPWFEQESVVDWLENREYLDAWGTEAQPCGYDPTRKTDEFGATAQAMTGRFVETAGFNYETGSEPVLYLYIWVDGANNLLPGRILRNQRTTDL